MAVAESYAELVLREEAEAQAALSQKKHTEEASAASMLGSGATGINLKDKDNFPSLGQVPFKTPNARNGWSAASNTALSEPFSKAELPALAPGAGSVPPKKTAASAPANAAGQCSRSFQLPVDHQRSQLPRLLDTCIQTARRTNTTIEASTSAQTKAINFIVKGRDADIAAAKRMLWSQLAQTGSIEVEVAEGLLGCIIGPGGKSLQAIEAASATKIKIPKGDEWKGHISISGDFEGVAMARDRILQIVKERTNKTTAQVPVERWALPFLWNEDVSGLTLQRLEEQYPRVQIQTVYKDDAPLIALAGDREDVAQAASLVEAGLIALNARVKHVSTHVKKSLHRLLVGPKGATRQKLEEKTGCVVIIPAAEKESENIEVYGPETKLLQGLSAVLEQIRGIATQSIRLSDIAAKILLNSAKHRNDLRAIEKESDVSIHQSGNELEVEGKTELLPHALKAVEALVSDLSAFNVSEVIRVDQEYLKHLIGKKGQTIQQLQKEFKVEIVINNGNDDILIAGTDASHVQAVIDKINCFLTSVADIASSTAKIDSKYHGMLIGPKGSNLAKYIEKYPLVSIKFVSDSDEVCFKGPNADVEACKAEFIAEVDALKHDMIMNSYQQPIPVPKESAKVLNNAKDVAFLHSLARQYDVKLIINAGAADEVFLQGVKKAVDAAVAVIQDQLKALAERDSLSFDVDSKYHGVLIGNEGRNMKLLTQKYSVKIDFPSKKESAVADSSASASVESAPSNTIKIVGPRSNITKARDELLDLLQYYLSHNHKLEFSVPSTAVPQIVGKGGCNIEALRMNHDCDVDLERGKTCTTVVIKGTETGIAAAKSEIEALVRALAEQSESLVQAPSTACLELLLSVFKREWFAFLDKYRSEPSNLQIFHMSKEGRVKLRGPNAPVAAASEELKNLFARIDSGALAKAEVSLPTALYGKILGAKGATVKAFMKEYDVDVQVPRPSESGPVIVCGCQSRIPAAVEALRRLATEDTVVKFSSRKVKESTLKKVEPELKALGVNWKDHPQGLVLNGESAAVAKAQELLKEEH